MRATGDAAWATSLPVTMGCSCTIPFLDRKAV